MSDTEVKSLSEMELPAGLSKYVVDVEDVGPVEVYVEGDMDKLRVSSNIFMTIHDAGDNFMKWVDFNKQDDMNEIKTRSLFLHVSLPGQSPGANNIDTFPTLNTLGMNLVNILDYLRIGRVLLLGEGAGANICLRFALEHPSRLHGCVLVNCSAGAGGKDRWAWALGQLKRKEERLNINMSNIAKYEEMYRSRGELLSSLSNKDMVDLLVVVENKARTIKDGEAIHKEMEAGLCSIIKLEDGEKVFDPETNKLGDAVVLFSQGLGLVPNARRKTCRSVSCNSVDDSVVGMLGDKMRRISMQQADLPMRRTSMTSHNI